MRVEGLALLEAFRHEFGAVVVPGDRQEAGPEIDGLDAVQWLYDNFHKNFSEVEWAGYFVKRKAQWFCDNIPNFPLRPHNREKNYRVKGDYLWDCRFHTVESPYLPFRDIVGFEMDLREFNGIGLIVLHSKTTRDTDGIVLRLQEQLAEGPSEYTQRLRAEGTAPRIRKRSFFVYYGEALYITPEAFERGFGEGWVLSNFQKEWRNSDRMPRNPKYLFDLGEVPQAQVVTRLAFNLDPDDFRDFDE